MKTPRDGQVIMREMVMPQHTNPQNTIFGGTVMSWVDIAAAMAAQKHSASAVVTVHVDDVTFQAPVKVGHHVILKACVNYVGNTSMEVGVRVEREDPITGENVLTTKAYLTFVVVDESGKPKQAPPLKPETDDELRRYENAKTRVAHRKSLQRKLN